VAEIEAVLPHQKWTLVGGLMTPLHAIHRGIDAIRPTNDVDIVLHVETTRGVAAQTASALESLGYQLTPSIDDRNSALGRHSMVGSMGRVGAAGDNAAMESFFALLQKNVLNRRAWATREELRIAIVTWIERTYHRRRRQAGLGRLTPIEYETIMTASATQAA